MQTAMMMNAGSTALSRPLTRQSPASRVIAAPQISQDCVPRQTLRRTQCSPLQLALQRRRQQRLGIEASAAASGAAGDAEDAAKQAASPVTDAAEEQKTSGGFKGYLASLFTPLKDRECNNKLLALCGAGMLSSVATMIHDSYLPIYLQDVLGMSNTKIGNLQAIAMFLSGASKSVSGTLGDILSPARMVIIGTLLTTLNKPMFAMSGWVYAWGGTVATLYWITAAKVADRMSKGIREAPTKALMGELAAKSDDRPEQAFGVRQASQTFGALVGATIAATTFKLSGSNFIMTFALSALPAATALAVVFWAFKDSAAAAASVKKEARAAKKAADKAAGTTEKQGLGELASKVGKFARELKPAYWQALAVNACTYFARFDWGFVMLRAKQVMPKSQLPGLMMFTFLVQTLTAPALSKYAKGSLRKRNQMLLFGVVPMVAANAAFALVPNTAGMIAGSLLVGLHMAATHGVMQGMMSSAIPAGEVPGLGRISGTVWSVTDLILGFVLAYSNSFAGKLSDITVGRGMGNVGCFYGGACAALTTGVLIILFWKFGSLGQDPQKEATNKLA